jgi:dipeptidyl aminopeptidase/acylaminoacyl peptidase
MPPAGAGAVAGSAGAASGARRPAVVFAHGGPPRQMLLGWHYRFYYANSYALNQYLASRGFVVLSVNFRLGIGYGYDFHQPRDGGIRGASEYQDVLAAGKFLQARADVDPARVGIWGGSYGGYLVALALGRNSDVFAAGVDIHGVHNRPYTPSEEVQQAAAVNDGVTRAQLDEAVRVAWQASPVSSVSTWKSPVLLIHGDDDRNVRVEQTVDLARRLKAAGVVYEEMIIPDDIHDERKLKPAAAQGTGSR